MTIANWKTQAYGNVQSLLFNNPHRVIRYLVADERGGWQERGQRPAPVRRLFETIGVWEAVAGVRFLETADITGADILIGAETSPRGFAFTNVDHARTGLTPVSSTAVQVRPIQKSLICLNPTKLWKIGFDGNLEIYDIRYTIAHEVGHAIGLDHPSPSGELMSFRYTEDFRTLQPGDVAGAVALYGEAGAASAAAFSKSSASGSSAIALH